MQRRRPATLLLALTVLGGGVCAQPLDLDTKAPNAGQRVIQLSWTKVPGAAGYRAYYGPAAGAETNCVELGAKTTARLRLPRHPSSHIVVRAYAANGVESANSNEILYPAALLVGVSGTGLQMSTSASPPAWVDTNSPWNAANPTGSGLFRSQDPEGPAIIRRLVYTPPTAAYYAATNGATTNSGRDPNAPWPLTYAISTAPAGSTVIVLPGTYSGNCQIDRPLTVRSQVKWAARLINLPSGLNIGYAANASGTILDGFEVAYSSMHGVELYSSNCTVRNCWVHDSGIYQRPYSGEQASSGIYGSANGTTIEYCLSENNGSTPGYDHGLYLAGTNLTIRGNVLRGNWGFGLHLYDPVKGVSGQVYDNLIYGNGAQTIHERDGVWESPRASNTIALWNNTILALNGAPIQGSQGTLCLTNNIILGPGGSVFKITSQTVLADYNLSSVGLNPYAGAHDVVSAIPNFVSPGTGLYWLLASSPARGKANPSIIPPTDFWGNLQSSVADIGAFQYSTVYEADTRVLDPSTASGADYWAQLSARPAAPVLQVTSETQ